MEQPADPNKRFPSTRWEHKLVKVRPSAGGHRRSIRAKTGFLRLYRLPRTESVRITVIYRGGAESWWLLKARGEHQAFPGHLCLEDVMARIYSEQ